MPGIEATSKPGICFSLSQVRYAFDFRELAVTAGPDVAFAVAVMCCGPDASRKPIDKDGFFFRLTVGLRKIEGGWRIAHEHHSVPAPRTEVADQKLWAARFDELDKVVEELKRKEKVDGRKKRE